MHPHSTKQRFLVSPWGFDNISDVLKKMGQGFEHEKIGFEIHGVECWFWSNDHSPPHFHAKKAGEWELVVRFADDEEEMFEQVWGDAPASRILRELRKAVRANRGNLLEEWESKVQHND